MEPNGSYETASTTLLLLEERIRRVDYILHGDRTAPTTSISSSKPQSEQDRPVLSATERLRKLERNLASLAAKSPAVADVLALQREHPTLFHPSTQNDSKPALPAPALAALVLSHAPLYTQSSANLQTLQSQSGIPDPAVLAKLIALQRRIERVWDKQVEQSKEFAELRSRSAGLVEQWYEEGVIGMGERWAEWERLVRGAERGVRRAEGRGRREEGVV